MTRVAFVIPGSLDTLTGGYGYDRRIIAGLRQQGWQVDVVQLEATFPFPGPQALDHAADALARLPADTTVVIDGLACGAMPSQVERAAERLRIIALVHHPLADESGLDPSAAETLEASERRALAAVRLVVVTSRPTAVTLERYGVTADRVRVVEPGTDPAPLARGSHSAVVNLLCVATFTPRKRHETLFHALAALPHLNWRLACIGSLERDVRRVEALRAILAAERLEERVVLPGEMSGDRLAAEYDKADVFVLPTEYEGYGMVVAEALARGIPVVSTPTGAIRELLGASREARRMPSFEQAGVLVPPGDVRALTEALAAIIGDATLRESLAEGACHVRDQLATWEESSRRMATVLEHVQR